MARSLSDLLLPSNPDGPDEAATVAQVDAAGPSEVAAVSAVTLVQDDVMLLARGSSVEQTITLSHVAFSDGTETLLATVTVPAESTSVITPPSFSRAFAPKDRLRADRVTGSGTKPLVQVMA